MGRAVGPVQPRQRQLLSQGEAKHKKLERQAKAPLHWQCSERLRRNPMEDDVGTGNVLFEAERYHSKRLATRTVRLSQELRYFERC